MDEQNVNSRPKFRPAPEDPITDELSVACTQVIDLQDRVKELEEDCKSWRDKAVEVAERHNEASARVEVLEKLKSQRNLEVCIVKTERDNLQARVAEMEKRIDTSQWVAAEELKKERARVEVLEADLVEERRQSKITHDMVSDLSATFHAKFPNQSGKGES